MSDEKSVPVSEDAPEVVAAAKWWTDVLRGGAKFDNGDPSPAGGMAWAMATMARPKFDPALLDRFEAELRKEIAAHINRFGGWRPTEPDWGSYSRCVSVDYGPCRVLADALSRAGSAEDAGIITFPWKTAMWVNPGKVTVRYGYSAPETTVYPALEKS